MQRHRENEPTSARNVRNRTAHDRTYRIMKQMNHHEKMIRYGNPLVTRTRRGQRGYPVMTYNDRSPEVAAMNAHLRASRYPEQTNEKRMSDRPRQMSDKMLIRNRMRSFLHLGKRYDTQARDNFIKEAVLFVLIVAASIWPIIHAVKAITAS